MRKKRSYMDVLYERYKNMPLSPSYKKMFFEYAKLFLKWMNHINHVLDMHHELTQSVTTAAGIRKCEEMKDYIDEVCYLRDTILVTLSMITLIGYHIPATETLEKFQKLYTLIDDNILNHLVIIQRYIAAIKDKKRMSFKGITKPITADDIQDMDCWPTDVLLDACFCNGTKLLSLVPYNRRKT